MTSPVTVTDADRKAAAEYVRVNFGARYMDRVLEGKSFIDLSKAFARHRVAALDEAAEVANNFYDDDVRDSYLEAASDIADAILALKGGPDGSNPR